MAFFSEDEIAEFVNVIAAGVVGADKDRALNLYSEIMLSTRAKGRLSEWAEQPVGDDALEAARRQLLPLVLLVEQRFAQFPRQWSEIFSRCGAGPEELYRSVEVRWIGLPQLRPRGAPAVRSDGGGERYLYCIDDNDFALSTAFNRGFLENSKSLIPGVLMGMAESFCQAEEIVHANVLNTGTAYHPAIVGDGKPLFSPEHPFDDGIYSNYFDYGLNEAAIEKEVAAIVKLPYTNGMTLQATPVYLVVPTELEYTAERLIGRPRGALHARWPVGYRVLDFLSSPGAWFLTTSIKGLISVHKKPFRLDLSVEDGALVLEGSQSYGAGYRNPRAVLGNFPKE